MTIFEKIDEYLTENSLPHFIDEDGNMVITYQGFRIICDNSEDDFLNLFMLGAYHFEDPNDPDNEDYEVDENSVEYSNVLQVCNHINKQYKVIKASIHNNFVILSIELFVPQDSQIDDILERCLNLCITAFDEIDTFASNL